MTEQVSESPSYQGVAVFSYGFRPFFLGAALFAGVAIPVWIVVLAGVGDSTFLYPARDWHVHEMVFGFLPAVITGFLLTAIPNWTDRPPIRGYELMLLFTLWLAGRLLIAIPWFTPLVSAIIDVGFLVAVAGLVWREIATAKSWDRAPMGVSPGLRQYPVPRAHLERHGGGSYRARGDRHGHDAADVDRRASHPHLYRRTPGWIRQGGTADILFPLRWPVDRARRICCCIMDCSTGLHGDGLDVRDGRVG